MIWFQWIIPIAAIIACIIIVLYSLIRHKWEKTAVIAIIVAIISSLGSLALGLGSAYSSDKSTQELKDGQGVLINKQDELYDKLSEISAKIDSNLPEEEPSDDLTEWVVKNRNDVIYKDDIFYVDIKVRKEGEKEWQRSIEADVGELLEFQIAYVNRWKEKRADDIMVRAVLPTNMEYVEDTTKLFNSNYQEGVLLDDNTVTTTGLNIGSYLPLGSAYVRFSTRVVDVDLAEGMNQLVTWATITQNGEALYYDANVFVEK